MARRTSTRWGLIAALAALAALVVSPGATAVGITPGGPAVTLTISNAGGSATASFTGAAGQRVSLNFKDVTITSSSVSFRKPDGTNLVTPFTVTKTGYFFDVHTLPDSGTYKIVVDAKQDYTGKATLTLYDVPADFSSPITANGTPVTVTTNTPGQNALLTFSGTAGQRVSANIPAGGTIKSAKLKIFNPDSTPLFSTALQFGVAGAFLEPKTLPTAGTYTILVDPTLLYKGSATVELYTVPADSTGAVATDGTIVNVLTAVPGQNAERTFTAPLAQRVSLLLSNSTYGSAKVSLQTADGTPVFAPARAISPLGTYISPINLAAGNYKVVVDPQSAETGSVDLQVFVVPPDVTGPITPGTPLTVTTTAPGQNALLSFSGTKDHRVSLNLLNSTFAKAKVSILRQDGTLLFSPALTVFSSAFQEPVKLPATETYKVKIDPQEAAYGSIDVGLYDVPPNPTATILPDGSPVTVSTTTPGQNATLTFTLTSVKRVSLELTGVTMASSATNGLKFKITKPDGTTLISSTVGTNGTFVDTQSLTQTGKYTILLDPIGAVFGNATVKLHTVPADVPGAILANGVPVSIAVATPGQNAYLTFSGTLGQRVAFQVSGLTASAPKVWLEKVLPAGSPPSYVFFKQTVNVDPQWFDTKALPSSGQYKIVFDPQGADIGGATFKLWTVPADVTGTLTPGSNSVTLALGQNARLTFSGTLGWTATITFSSGTISLAEAKLYRPTGTQLGSATWDPTITNDTIQEVLPATGTYTFLLDPVAERAGSETFTLSLSPPA